MWLWIILAALAIYVLKYFAWVAKYPKGPRPLPFIGNCLQLDPKNVYKNFADFGKQYGSVFTVFTPEPIVVLSDYEAVKDAFVYHGDDFSGRPRNKFMELFEIQRNGGILSSVGENWRDQRRTALNALRDLGMGKNVMEEKVKHSIREYLKELEQLPDKDDVDFTWPLQFMVCGVIFDTIFGKYDRHDEELDEFLHKFHKTAERNLEIARMLRTRANMPDGANIVPLLEYLDKLDPQVFQRPLAQQERDLNTFVHGLTLVQTNAQQELPGGRGRVEPVRIQGKFVGLDASQVRVWSKSTLQSYCKSKGQPVQLGRAVFHKSSNGGIIPVELIGVWV